MKTLITTLIIIVTATAANAGIIKLKKMNTANLKYTFDPKTLTCKKVGVFFENGNAFNEFTTKNKCEIYSEVNIGHSYIVQCKKIPGVKSVKIFAIGKDMQDCQKAGQMVIKVLEKKKGK